MRLSRNFALCMVPVIAMCCFHETLGQTVVYQQFFHNRFDHLPFPMNGWQAHYGSQLYPVHPNDGGVVPVPSCDYGQLGYAEYTGTNQPVIFWTDDLGTNTLSLEQIGEISFFQKNDTPSTKARLFLAFQDEDQVRFIASRVHTESTNISSWTESVYVLSTNNADWLVVQAFEPAQGRKPGSWNIANQSPDFPVRGTLTGFGFCYSEVDGVIRIDHILVKEKEPLKAVFPFPFVYIKIGFAVLGLLVVIYIITHITVLMRSLSKTAHDANEILHGHATTSHHIYDQSTSEDSDKRK